MSGPSDKAVEAGYALQVAHAGLVNARDILDAAHDPALGLDRSVCLRDVVDALRHRAASLPTLSPGQECGWHNADFLEREFAQAHLLHREDER